MQTTLVLQEEATLTALEETELQVDEEVIEQGLRTFYEVGAALADIRDRRLYREKYRTFEEYCRERWGISSDYARKTIRAAETYKAIETDTIVSVLPDSESQVRPLTKLERISRGTSSSTYIQL